MGVGGELLGRDGEIECGIDIRFSELYDLKIRNSSLVKEGKKSLGRLSGCLGFILWISSIEI